MFFVIVSVSFGIVHLVFFSVLGFAYSMRKQFVASLKCFPPPPICIHNAQMHSSTEKVAFLMLENPGSGGSRATQPSCVHCFFQLVLWFASNHKRPCL